MTAQKACEAVPAKLTVIRGGADAPAGDRPSALTPPAPPLPGPVELAGNMAEIYALSLLRDHPAEALADPHLETRIDRRTVFTLHDLLCELRNLPWFDTRSAAAAQDPLSSGEEGDAGHRRSLSRNGDGQLTLRTLLRSGVALEGPETGASALWREDATVAQAPRQPRPDETAPMSAWVAWCAGESGAGLRLPGLSVEPAPMTTPGTLARMLPAMPAARPFHNVALSALARGALPLALPAGGDLWTGARLFALMAEAERLASQMVQAQAASPDRASRPGVTAARMTLWLTRQEREIAPARAEYRAAAESLAEHAPRLLHWVSRANAARRGVRRKGMALFLPLAGVESLEYGPSDTAAHVIVAGALATLLKAVLYRQPADLHRIGSAVPAVAEVDRMVRDIARARVIAGACLPAEAFVEMRMGQAIALHLLRAALERDNRSLRLSLRDFDGRALVLQANPRHFGRGCATLRGDGQPIAWPQEGASPTAHLTQVV